MADYGRIAYEARHDLVDGPDGGVARVAYEARHDLVDGPDGGVARVFYIARHDLVDGFSLWVPTTQATGRTKVNGGGAAEVPAGSKITIQGQDLTSTHGTPTSGGNNFKGNAGSATAIVASLVSAINDGGNAFGSIVSGQVDPTDAERALFTAAAAAFPGTQGNAITLTTNDPVNLTVTAFAGGALGLQESIYISESLSGTHIPKAGAEGLQGDVLQGDAVFGWQIQQGMYGFQGGRRR